MFSIVDLPQPDGPSRQTNSPSPHFEADVVEHGTLTPLCSKTSRDRLGVELRPQRERIVEPTPVWPL